MRTVKATPRSWCNACPNPNQNANVMRVLTVTRSKRRTIHPSHHFSKVKMRIARPKRCAALFQEPSFMAVFPKVSSIDIGGKAS